MNKMVVVFVMAVQDLHTHRESMLAALYVVLDVTMVKQHISRVGGMRLLIVQWKIIARENSRQM